MSKLENGVTVQNGKESSLVVEVKEKQDSDQSCLNLRAQSTIIEWGFSFKGGDGMLRYLGSLCVPMWAS